MTRAEFLKTFPGLVKNYQPAPEILKRIHKIRLVMIIGPSGVGKSTLIAHSGLAFVPSDTTRIARPGEKDGKDMFFRNDYAQVIDDIKNGRFVQIAPHPSGDFYATKITSYPAAGIAIMPVRADVVTFFRQLGFKRTISAFIAPPSYEEWSRRLKSHPMTPERLTEAKFSLQFSLADKETHFILNDDLDKAAAQLKNLLAGKVDKDKEKAAENTARSILNQLQTV